MESNGIMSLFGQDVVTFTSYNASSNIDQLQMQLGQVDAEDTRINDSMKERTDSTVARMTTVGQGMIQMLMIQIFRHIYDEEPMAEVGFTSIQKHVKLKVICLIHHTIEQTTYLLANNADLKAQIQEKVFSIAALKNYLKKLKGNSFDTKFAKTSILGKPVLQSLRNQSVVRQLNAFKSERAQMSKQQCRIPRSFHIDRSFFVWVHLCDPNKQFASQVDVNKNLSKPVTQHYLPKKTEFAFVKPDIMIASSSSRNSFKNMPRFSSYDMFHNHYLDVAKKKIQERDMNSTTSVTTSARFQSTADDNKPKPRSNNQTSRSFPVSKSTRVMITVVPKADHSKSSSSFSNSKNF
ncbi:hypothetical protein Tco_0739628, partial [Tanacetum coccineum]